MPEPKQDVNVAPSPTDEEQVVAESTPAEEQAVEQQNEPSQLPEVKEEGETVVKDNRPVENVAWEAKRKVDELYGQINDIKTLLQQKQETPAKPQYSKAQLQAWLQTPDLPPENKVWALEEIDRLDKTERRREMEEVFGAYVQRSEGERQKQESFNYIVRTFPDSFIRDGDGNVVSPDPNHPLTQKISEYMRIKEFAHNPRGLEIAAKTAAFDLGLVPNRKMEQKLTRTNAQLKREQKKTLIAGGGANPLPGDENSKSHTMKLADKYRQTRDINTFKELIKRRGLIPNT